MHDCFYVLSNNYLQEIFFIYRFARAFKDKLTQLQPTQQCRILHLLQRVNY